MSLPPPSPGPDYKLVCRQLQCLQAPCPSGPVCNWERYRPPDVVIDPPGPTPTTPIAPTSVDQLTTPSAAADVDVGVVGAGLAIVAVGLAVYGIFATRSTEGATKWQ